VDVRVQILWHIVVNYVSDSFHVDTTSCDVSRDHDAIPAILKSRQRLLTLPLREISVKRCHVLSLLSKLVSELLRGMLHLRKYNHKSITVLSQPVSQHLGLRLWSDTVQRVAHGSLRVFHLNAHNLRIVLNAAGKILNLRRHGRGEEQCLTLSWDLLNNLLDVRKETHVEHAVSFVENESLYTREVYRSSTKMVQETAWARYDDLWATTKVRHLTSMRHTAVNRYALNARTRSELLDTVVNLLSKLTSRSENERLAPLFLASRELLQDRQYERRGLSSTSLRETDNVVSLDSERNSLGLNWGWGLISDRLDRFLQEMSEW
jgi:hypothetical protein